MENLDNFSKQLIQKLRDEVYSGYLQQIEYAQSTKIDEYILQKKNQIISPDLKRIEEERFRFINNLSQEECIVLNRLILNIIDNIAFNFLKEIEENNLENDSIGLTFKGKNIEIFSDLLLSGTLYGEYFLWCENKSKFGPFQN